MSTIREAVDRELIAALVGRAIFCPRTGETLDARTCVVIRDADGDPVAVISQAGYADSTNEERANWRRHDLFVDHDTVTSSPFQVVGAAVATLTDQGHCDTCGDPCDSDGCTRSRDHIAAIAHPEDRRN